MFIFFSTYKNEVTSYFCKSSIAYLIFSLSKINECPHLYLFGETTITLITKFGVIYINVNILRGIS